MKRKFNIKGKISAILTWFVPGIFFGLLVYTRLIGIGWGLPYPMHPDERNMVIGILTINCQDGISLDCLNPQFWAYGQFPLYLAHILMWFWKASISLLGISQWNNHLLATISLRILSATASIFSAVVLIKILQQLVKVSKKNLYIVSSLFIFTPVFIQSAHFGTTESALMLFVSLLFYISVLFVKGAMPSRRYIVVSGILLGVAMGIKVSALLFAFIPFVTYVARLYNQKEKHLLHDFFSLFRIGIIMLVFFIITSPYNIIDWEGFVHSMNYESSVGTGAFKAFYTRQFEYTIPFLFQIFKIFPFALGIPLFFLSIGGFIALSWKRVEINMMRIILLLLFIPNALLYAKWTRFLAPVFPFMLLIVAVFYAHILERIRSKVLAVLVTIIIILPGMGFVTIYMRPDVRFQASAWIYENIPPESFILFETANVVDVPIPNPYGDPLISAGKYYKTESFNFYELDNNPSLDDELDVYMQQADYIIIPSRRVYWNHTCITNEKLIMNNEKLKQVELNKYLGYQKNRCDRLKEIYPLVNRYYQELLESGRYEQVAKFSSYPRIELFGKTILSFPDESAEETFTVFDHPVIRVYRRI